MNERILFFIFSAIIVGVFGYMFLLHGPLGMNDGDSEMIHPESMRDVYEAAMV